MSGNLINSNSDGVSSSGSGSTRTGNLTSTAATSTSATLQEDTPRDVRLLHLLLASQAIHQYEDQVPLQLMDFAYRYTRGVLKDAMIYNEYMEANMVHDTSKSASTPNTNATSATTQTQAQAQSQAQTQTSNQDSNQDQTATTTTTTSTSDQKSQSSSSSSSSSSLTIEDIRLAIAARTQYQFKPTAPRELLLQLAAERNKKALPQVLGSWGIRLPPEKYCLTAKEWDLSEDRTVE